MAVDLKSLIDINLLGYFKSKLDLIFANKVDKVDGKGLSANDYTSNEKTKLANIEAQAQVNKLEGIQVAGTTISATNKIVNIPVATQSAAGVISSDDKKKLDGVASGAQVNVLESVKVNGTALTITEKAVNVTVPTKVSDIDNDSGFITIADVPEGAAGTTTTPKMDGTAAVGTETAFARGDHVHPHDSTKADAASVYTKTEIDQKLVGAMNYKGTKATTSALPSSGNAKGDVWHVTADGSEWAWNGEAWEELGSIVDLSGYVEENDLGLATNEDIDALFA